MDFALPVARATCSFSKGNPGNLIFQKLKDRIAPEPLFLAIREKAQQHSKQCKYLKAARAYSNFADAHPCSERALEARKEAIHSYEGAIVVSRQKRQVAIRLSMLSEYFSLIEACEEAGHAAEVPLLVCKVQELARDKALSTKALRFLARHSFAHGEFAEASDYASKADQSSGNEKIAFILSGNGRHVPMSARRRARKLGEAHARDKGFLASCNAELGEPLLAYIAYRDAAQDFALLGMQNEALAAGSLRERHFALAKKDCPTLQAPPVSPSEVSPPRPRLARLMDLLGGH